MPDLPEDERCECEFPGAYHTGVPGILAWLNGGVVPVDAGVERCDLCRRYASDAAAEAKLRELGMFHLHDPRAGEPTLA